MRTVSFEVSKEEIALFLAYDFLHGFYIYAHLKAILQPNFQSANVGR